MKRFGWKLPFSLLAAGICLAFVGAKSLIIGFLPTVDLDDPSVDWGKLKANQHVEIEYMYTDGYFYYVEEDNKDVARRYAVIDIQNIDDMVYLQHYMGININNTNDFARYDKAAEETYSWMCGTGYDPTKTYVAYDGYLRKMTKDEKEAMRSWIAELGWSSEEIEDTLVPYVIMENESQFSNILMLAGGLLLLAISVVMIIFNVKKD